MTLLPWIAKNIERDGVFECKRRDAFTGSRDLDIGCFLMSFGRDGVIAKKRA